MKITCTIPLLASAVFISALAARPALAIRPAPEPPAKVKAKAPSANVEASEKRAKEILEALRVSGAASERMSLAAELAGLQPMPVAFLDGFLKRTTRSSSDEERRAVLTAAGAEVPDENGRFKTPQRQTTKVEQDNDEFDWLAALATQPKAAGLGDVIADVAAIRALAASKRPAGGAAILDFAFSDLGLTYRDECGRYLRIMSPFSLPALIRGSQSRKNKSMHRYASYQLERLDRENPHKAFAAAPTEEMQIAVLKAFADSQYREAVFAVLDQVDHVAPRVREAARAAWTEYVSGRPPPKPPERKLQLPGGKLDDEKSPLWLDHRELADAAIRKRLEELTGKKPNKHANLVQLTEQLFAFYDQKRAAALDADFESAVGLAQAGKTNEAAGIFDRILAQRPDYGKRSQMVQTYMDQAKGYEDAGNWKEAAIAYGKANMVDPEGPQAKAALKKHHQARAEVAKASGQDATTELAIADEIVDDQDAATESKLMLFAGLAAIGGAIALLFLALALRRRSSVARAR